MNRTVSAALLAVTAAVYLFSFVASADRPIPGFSACTMRFLTGVPCPLCGMTRAFSHISKGDIAGAVRLNALSPLFYLGGLVLAAAFAADFMRFKRFGTRSLGRPLPIVLAVCLLLIAYWVFRIAWTTHTGELWHEVAMSPLGRVLQVP